MLTLTLVDVDVVRCSPMLWMTHVSPSHMHRHHTCIAITHVLPSHMYRHHTCLLADAAPGIVAAAMSDVSVLIALAERVASALVACGVARQHWKFKGRPGPAARTASARTAVASINGTDGSGGGGGSGGSGEKADAESARQNAEEEGRAGGVEDEKVAQL